MNDPRFPLGKPINRPPPASPWHAIPNRPHWVRHIESGEVRYVEPVKPPVPPHLPI
jgi:hypothetical protein